MCSFKPSHKLKIIAFNREHFARLADRLAVAFAVSLPWSTSATGIIAGLWLVALIPTLDLASLRRVVLSPAGGFPVVLVALGAAGMLWADVSWAERVNGIGSFAKFLFIPLLLNQFYGSKCGRQVLIGFLTSCALLLVVSWSLWVWPGMPWLQTLKSPGVPVKDYIAQSAMFTICSFVLAEFAYRIWRANRRLALALISLVLVFVANILYVATSRTYLVVFPALMLAFGYRHFGWKGAISLIFGCFVLAAAAWPSASFMRQRVGSFFDEVRSYQPGGRATSAGERLVYWTKAVEFIRERPLFGYGTGSINQQYRRAVIGKTGMAAEISANPHNQILAVGIQIGLVGVVALLAMWLAHLALFRSDSFAGWVGLVVVIQNMIGSLFNSHLFDFTHGWAYVVGVGIAGGIVLKGLPRRPNAG